jgi:hypothetical protein
MGALGFRRLALFVVCIAALSGCGGGHRQDGQLRSVSGVAHMKMTKEEGGRIKEEGNLTGAFPARLALYINAMSGEIVRFTIAGHAGTLVGSASLRADHFLGNAERFENSGLIKKGTGAFASIRPSTIRFMSYDERSGAITNTVSGEVTYR